MPSPGTAPPGRGPSTASRPPDRPRVGGTARAGLVLLALSVVVLWPVAAAWSPLMSFDRSVAESLHRRAVTEPGLVHANRILTDWVWDPWTMRALTAAIVIGLCLRRAWPLALWVAATVGLGSVLQQSVKAAVDRDRPKWPDPVDSAHYSSFPSGHAMTAAVVLVVVLWLLRRYGVRGRAWAVSVILVAVSVVGVGLTRLYLGVHWPSDVLGGWLMGVGWALLATAAYPWVERRFPSRTTVPSNGGATDRD
ncbi:phosphatase PAP2 family protein [Streptomyces sp. NPDC059248]|uniref:phosphatase PAP2 family protein n=1 Tax=Streptomyces sp. NPDC059248 TaxID=3346791 RepID=UPI0036CFFD25